MRTHQDASKLLEELQKLEEEFQQRRSELLRKYSANDEVTIPAEAFATELTPYETAVSALKHKRGFSNAEIAEELSRSESSVSNTLRNAEKKEQEMPWPDSDVLVPTNIFTRDLSPGQALVLYLYEQDISIADTARLIGRDPRNVQATLQKAKKRGGIQ